MNSNVNNQKYPDFIGIGAMKAASTWIFTCLNEHPEICMGETKEIHFFDQLHDYRKGVEYYSSFFNHCNSNKIKGEFTPSYIHREGAAQRIYHCFPQIKLIACLRNPVNRAYSEYRYAVQQKGKLSLYSSFKEAIERDLPFREKGYYYQQLKEYFDLFPAENIKVMIFQHLKKNPTEFIQEIYSFLDLDNAEYIPSTVSHRRNVTGSQSVRYKIPGIAPILYWLKTRIRKNSLVGRWIRNSGLQSVLREFVRNNRKIVKHKDFDKQNTPSLSTETREKVYHIYRRDISNLEQLLDRSLDSWRM